MKSRAAAIAARLGDELGGSWVWSWIEPPSDRHGIARFVDAAAPDRSWIVKFYPEASGQRVAQALAHLTAELPTSARDRWLAIPPVRAYDPQQGALIQQPASGVRLADASADQLLAALPRVGGALAQLHTLDPPPGFSPKSTLDHLADLLRPDPAMLVATYPQYERRIVDALQLIKSSDDPLRSPGRWVTLHRDFQLRQLFDDGRQIAIVDWDDVAVGDAAFDVGYLVAYLEAHLAPEAAAPAVTAFLQGYVQEAGSSTVAERLSLWRVFNTLRRALRRFRRRDAGWEPEVERMMARLAEQLDRYG